MARKSMHAVRDDQDDDTTGPQEVSMDDAMAEDAVLASQEPATPKVRNRWDPAQNHAFYDYVARNTDKETHTFTGTLQGLLEALEPHFPEGIDEARVKSKWNGTIFALKKKHGKKFPAFPGSTPRTAVDEIGNHFAKYGIDLPAVSTADTSDDTDDEDGDENDE